MWNHQKAFKLNDFQNQASEVAVAQYLRHCHQQLEAGMPKSQLVGCEEHCLDVACIVTVWEPLLQDPEKKEQHKVKILKALSSWPGEW